MHDYVALLAIKKPSPGQASSRPSRCSWIWRAARGWMNLDASPADAASYVSASLPLGGRHDGVKTGSAGCRHRLADLGRWAIFRLEEPHPSPFVIPQHAV